MDLVVSRKTCCIAAAAAAPLLFYTLPAAAQSVGSGSEAAATQPTPGRAGDLQVFGGLRAWANAVEGIVLTRAAVLNPSGTTTYKDVKQQYSSDPRLSAIPFIGVRYRDFTASVSYLLRTGYNTQGLLDGDVHRTDFDVNLGYYVLPRLAASVAYKRLKIDKVSPYVGGGTKTDLFLLGLAGSVPLETSSRLSLYGNVAYGLGKVKSESTPPLTTLDADYRIGEIGLSYSLLSAPTGALKNLVLSLGYRAQVATYRNLELGTYPAINATTPSSVERQNFHVTSDGFVLGLVGVF